MTSSHNRNISTTPTSPSAARQRKPMRHPHLPHPHPQQPPPQLPPHRNLPLPHTSSPVPTTPPLPPPSPTQPNPSPPSPASPTTPPPPRTITPPSARPRPRPSHHRSNPHTDPVLPPGTRVRITGNNRTKWDLIGRHGTVLSAQTLGGWHEVSLTDGGIVRVQRNALHVLKFPNRHTPPLPTRPSIAKPQANISKLNVASLRRYRTVYNLDVAKDCSKDELVGAVKKHFEKAKVNESEVITSFLRQISRQGASSAGAE
eukprot:TRINITY_DN3660_c0_g1_i1.p1 TRINITY_DN3660_c0_g1~~TRINITY_DN3660_c0_g1_i1.p1  ORF type:complete len:267 (+),score=33.78 TRINITY_DN3660_c0_g1_i1:28-801(+)